MCNKKSQPMSERGWTFIEATMGVILTSILVLGLAVTILAMRETIDRSFTIRVMDQYGNDIMRHFQLYFETAVNVNKIASQSSGTMDHFDIIYRDPFTSVLSSARYRASRSRGVLKDGQRIDEQFPPTRVPRGETGMLHPGETFTITKFTITNEITSGNMSAFSSGVWRVTLGLRYTKLGGRGEPDLQKDMTYSTLLVAKNSFLDAVEMY